MNQNNETHWHWNMVVVICIGFFMWEVKVVLTILVAGEEGRGEEVVAVESFNSCGGRVFFQLKEKMEFKGGWHNYVMMVRRGLVSRLWIEGKGVYNGVVRVKEMRQQRYGGGYDGERQEEVR